jgi:MarR family transcriptional regulator, organic hydroperoxide resistance regulator
VTEKQSPGDSHHVQAERDIRERLAGHELDFVAMSAVSNIYRAASAVRNHMERTVLGSAGLSWTAFTTLFVLWIWGDLESRHLAARTGVSKGTLTGVVRTLQTRGLCWREQRDDDRRLVVVGLTCEGRELMEELFPRFNAEEVHVTSGLDEAGKGALADHLRAVITAIDGDGDGGARRNGPPAVER